MTKTAKEDSKGHAGCATSTAILPGGGSQKGNIKGNAKGTNFNVKDKGKFNNVEGSGPSAKGQQWRGQQWGSWNTRGKGGGKGAEVYNLESDPHGEWSTIRQTDMLSFEKGLPNTKVVEHSKVAKERSEEVTEMPRTGRFHALGRIFCRMQKVKVKQGESKRNNKWNKEQSATPPASPKPAPTRRTTKTASNLEEAYINQYNCTDHNNARER